MVEHFALLPEIDGGLALLELGLADRPRHLDAFHGKPDERGVDLVDPGAGLVDVQLSLRRAHGFHPLGRCPSCRACKAKSARTMRRQACTTGTARTAMHGSCRPVSSSVASVRAVVSTVFC